MTRIVSRDVKCPTCGAEPGSPCVGSSRGRVVQSHHHRVESAKVCQNVREVLQDEVKRAAARQAQVPAHARPVVTKPLQ